MSAPCRIGLIVPSSNVTIETELPQLLQRVDDCDFTFHSSRMRMATVSEAELASMNAQRERCVDELADARVDVIVYGCLVALMAEGSGSHERAERAIGEQLLGRGLDIPIVSSAGALLEGIAALGADRIALVTPYLEPLAKRVVQYLEASGVRVVDWVALGIADNAEVACIEGGTLLRAVRALDMADARALVISACVQMPSLGVIAAAEVEFGLPVLSAATATASAVSRRVESNASLPGAGRRLANESAPQEELSWPQS